MLSQREQIPHEHGEPTVARHRDHLAPGITHLRADGLRQSVGHRPVREGTEYPPLTIHGQIPRGPDGWSSYVAGENRVLGRELVDYSRDILRMDRFLAGIWCREFVQSLARLPVIVD